MTQWFRMYHETLDDPKVQKLHPEVFKAWVNLLCLAARHDGKLPSLSDIAFALRVPEKKAEVYLKTLENAGLFDKNDDGLEPHNWNGRQYKSDVSTDRVREHRKRKGNAKRNGDETFHETPPETESDTETESEQKERVSPPNGGSPPSDLTAIPPPLAKPSEADTVAEMWNLMAKKAGLPECRSLTQARKIAANARVREAGIDGVAEAMKKIGRSSFCRGENDRGWRANFDFLIKQSSFTKLMEGHYDDNSPAKRDWSHLDA